MKNVRLRKRLVLLMLVWVYFVAACGGRTSQRGGRSCKDQENSFGLETKAETYLPVENEAQLPKGTYTVNQADMYYAEDHPDNQDVRVYAVEKKDNDGNYQSSFFCAKGWKASQPLSLSTPAASQIKITSAGVEAESREFSFQTGIDWSVNFTKSSGATVNSVQKAFGENTPTRIYEVTGKNQYEIRAEIQNAKGQATIKILYDFTPLSP